MDLRPAGNSHKHRGIGRYVSSLLPIDVPGTRVLEIYEERRWGIPRIVCEPDTVRVFWPPRPRVRLDSLSASLLKTRLSSTNALLTHLTDPYSLGIAPPTGTVLCHIYDLIGYGANNLQGRRFTAGLEQVLLRSKRSTHFAAISDTVAAELNRVGVAADRIHVLRPGPTTWPSGGKVHRTGAALVVGAVDQHKQPEVAREAALLAGVPVIFAGPVSRRTASKLGLGPGQVWQSPSDADLAGLLRGALCLLHASSAEGFGLPVLEALKLGCPVAAFDLPVTREIVGPQYPLAALEGGAASLANLVDMFRNSRARQNAVDVASAYIARFDWAQTKRSLKSLYLSLLSQQHEPQ